jgi:hypothetical protein
MQKKMDAHSKVKKPYVNNKRKAKTMIYNYLRKNGAQWLSTISDDLNNVEFEILLEAIMELEREHKIKEVSEDKIGKHV